MSSIFKHLLTIAVFASMNMSLSAAPGLMPKEMSTLFPIGRTFEGVKIPSYTNSVLKSVMEADTIIRVDQTFLELTNLIIKVYTVKGELESTIKMDEATFHLVTRQLLSKTPAEVEHTEFVMTGDQLGYDAANEVTTMEGRVRVVIPDAGKFTGNFGTESWGK